MAKEDEAVVEDFRLSDIESIGNASQRLAFYEGIQDRLISYIPITPLELALYTYGIFRDSKMHDSVGFGELDYVQTQTILDKAEARNPGMTQSEELGKASTIMDSGAAPEQFVEKFLTSALIASVGTTPAMNLIGRVGGKVATGAKALLGSTKGKVGLGLLGAFGVGITVKDDFLTGEEAPGELPSEAALGTAPTAQEATTRNEPANAQEEQRMQALGWLGSIGDEVAAGLNLRRDGGPTGGGTTSTASGGGGSRFANQSQALGLGSSAPGLAPDLQALALAAGVDPSQLPSQATVEAAGMNTNIFGEININPKDFPFGSSASGVPLSAAGLEYLQSPGLTTGDPRMPPDQQALGNVGSRLTLPPGAQINPAAFKTFNGQSLFEIAAIAADNFDVPIALLYGLIQHESNWNPDAFGDREIGGSYGLAQIYQSVWGGQISIAQSKNPVFALNWAANHLAENKQRYGSWEAAIIAHNHPVGAQHYAETGKFLIKKNQDYLASILNSAAASGTSNYVIDFLNLSNAGVTLPGPDTPAFVEPDPATLREYLRTTYDQILGRAPTDAELETGAKGLVDSFRQAHQAEVSKIMGSKNIQGVDPQAVFEEQLSGSGEAQFAEDRTQTRKMGEHLGNISALLRSS